MSEKLTQTHRKQKMKATHFPKLMALVHVDLKKWVDFAVNFSDEPKLVDIALRQIAENLEIYNELNKPSRLGQ